MKSRLFSDFILFSQHELKPVILTSLIKNRIYKDDHTNVSVQTAIIDDDRCLLGNSKNAG